VLVEYINEALKLARYELIEDEDPYYGEIPEINGVWASAKSLEECREQLRETLEDWIILSFRKNLPIPHKK
jgi:predicted RNase H-like HicB family nuclease